MVKVKRSFPAPESLAEESEKAAGRYDKEDVIERLKEDFHNKCYICEFRCIDKIYLFRRMEILKKVKFPPAADMNMTANDTYS